MSVATLATLEQITRRLREARQGQQPLDLSPDELDALIKYLEFQLELERDAQALEEAVRTETEFVPWEEVLKEWEAVHPGETLHDEL
jgi:hypothetical protein